MIMIVLASGLPVSGHCDSAAIIVMIFKFKSPPGVKLIPDTVTVTRDPAAWAVTVTAAGPPPRPPGRRRARGAGDSVTPPAGAA